MKNINSGMNSWTTKININSNSPIEIKNKYEKIIDEFSAIKKGSSVNEYKKNLVKTLNPLYEVLLNLNETIFENEETKNIVKKIRKKILIL